MYVRVARVLLIFFVYALAHALTVTPNVKSFLTRFLWPDMTKQINIFSRKT